MIDPVLLEILRCPIHPDGPPLTPRGDFLICGVDGFGYRVINDIPRMLPEDAIAPDVIGAELAAGGPEKNA
jgi:uncharacterized protein YbaR (Trm112 family)